MSGILARRFVARTLATALLLATAAASLALLPVVVSAQKIKVHVERDKEFKFKGLRTWNWHPDGAGDVKMLSMSTDDPKPIKAMLDPMVVASVEKALTARGLQKDTAGPTDLLVNYYILVMPATTSTQVGQFLPPVTEYGIPVIMAPTTPTTRLKAFEQGTLVLDLVAPALKSVIWRGIAETEAHRDYTPEQRRARIDKAVQEIVKKLPKT